MRRLSLRPSVLALGLLIACGQDNDPLTPRTFERPGDIAFACYEPAARTLHPLADCEGLSGVSTEPLALIGLVTQTSSGQVGAVDFQARRVVDADPRVPGFTFTTVGEFPTAIAVSAVRPEMTYVASYGSRRVEVHPTTLFLNAPRTSASTSVALGGAPTDLVLGPETPTLPASAVYAVVPETGAVFTLPIDGTGALADGVPLTLSTPADLTPPTVGVATEYEIFCQVAPDGISEPDASQVRAEVVSFGDSPEPHALLLAANGPCVDPAATCDAELLVADRRLPLIHRLAVGVDGSLTELPPIATGAPIRDLAVSPRVPAGAPGSGMEGVFTKYLYAIDDTDQSVMVIDYTDGSTTFGSVLPVRGGEGRSDRLRLQGAAHHLEVITPSYDPAELAYCASPSGGEGPTRLRGVFLSVGLASGFVQLIDVVDLDATCRGVECAGPMASPNDQFVYLQRHRPRVGTYLAQGIGILGSPLLTVDGVNRQVNEPLLDALVAFRPPGAVPSSTSPQECMSGHAPLVAPTVCAAADPWALPPEVWTATWRGTVPGTTTLAKMSTDGAMATFELLPGSPPTFCERGVLGSADVAQSGLRGPDETFPGDPERGYPGDYVVITIEPDVSMRGALGGLCDPYFEPDDGTDRVELAFRIVEATETTLLVDLRPVSATPQWAALTRGCFGPPEGAIVGIEVRVGEVFRVQGSSSGFIHRVVERDGGCVVDTLEQPVVPSQPSTYRNGRAFIAALDPDADPPALRADTVRPYVNPYIAFTLGAVPVVDDAQLELVLTGLPDLFVASVGQRGSARPVPTIIEDVVYSETDERLYVIDAGSSSLVQFQLNNFQVLRVFE